MRSESGNQSHNASRQISWKCMKILSLNARHDSTQGIALRMRSESGNQSHNASRQISWKCMKSTITQCKT
ncbi:hypothetical protein BgiMline_014562 [Biomphalaria glabrata]|nr:hypothetical protein BgiMline_013308 [Biomphalaria glabrata]